MAGLGALLAATLGAASRLPATPPADTWNPKAAVAYLDQRESWWMAWPVAARDHHTFCISCHTAVPYALSRPALRAALGEQTATPDERELVDDVTKRVRLWNDVKPFYTDQGDGTHKSAQSRGTEAVLNALILASYDSQSGKLGSDTLLAFQEMWALQEMTGEGKGAWGWLQFNNEPWEAHDSEYYGAAVAAVAAGEAPDNYRAAPEIQNNLKLLREYLGREYPNQSPINHVVLLWASEELPGLLTRNQQEAIIDEVVRDQRADGGWSLASLCWTRKDWSAMSLVKLWLRSDATPLEPKSDGYATGLITFALEKADLPRVDAHLKQGLAWLVRNQNKTEGRWPAYSVNGRRDPSSGTGHFMSDAATAYAVLALTENERHRM